MDNVVYMPRHSGKKSMVTWKDPDIHGRADWRYFEMTQEDPPPEVRAMFPRYEGYVGDIHVMTLYSTTALNESLEDSLAAMIFLPGIDFIQGEPGDTEEDVMQRAQAEFQDWLERAELQEKNDE